jgi:hypothetical protein
MPLSGAIQADFGALVDEAQKASAALGVMDAEAKKTGQTLAKTGAAVDGFKAPASLSQLTAGLRTVDASANAMGVSMAKPIAAIEELGKVSGMTYAQLGLLGTAGVAVGVAITGWELGKWFSDMTGGLETAKNLQDWLYGSADAADAAANKAAILQLAFDRTGVVFTDVNLAVEANIRWVKEHQQEIKKAADRQAHWEGILRQFGGALPRMEEALANHTATVKQLAVEYGIDADALTYYIAKKKEETAVLAKSTAETEAAAAAQQKLRDQMFGGDSITKANEMALALGGVGSVSRMTTEEQAKLNTAVGEAIETYKRWGQTAPAALNEIYLATLQLPPVVTGLGSEWANVGTKVTQTADHIVADVKRMKDETASYEAETLRQMEASWQKVPPPVAETTKEVQRLTVAMQDFGRVNRSAWESMQAGAELMKGYQDAGIFVGMQGGALTGYQAQQRTRMATEAPTGGAAWGNTLNVNVNSTEAGDISKKLVDEMRRNGVRF